MCPVRDPVTRAEVERLRRELARLQSQVIVRVGSTSSAIVPVLSATLGTDTITTIGANAYKGILTPGTVPTEVPQANPSALVSFPSYLGKARLNGSTWVWVAVYIKPYGVTLYDLAASIPNNQVFMSRTQVDVPITGGGGTTAKVYLPWVI